tara:strand:+ start:3980 stop:4786 length:807 start_codon:yes stop_codon:yes gene_type:complete
MDSFKIITIFIIGLCFGSFINVIRYRFNQKQSIIFPNSYCDNCKIKLDWVLNIPIFSWLFLQGKCKFCKFKIPYSYPLIEIFVGIIFVINNFSIGYFFIDNQIMNLIIVCIFSFFLITISLIDIDHYIIPNILNLILIIISIPLILKLQINIDKNNLFLFQRVLSSIIFFIVLESFSSIYKSFFKKYPYGVGDSKLIAVFILWLGIEGTLITLVLAIYLAGLFIFLSWICKNSKYKSIIPFGPFLCLGAYLTIFFGNEFFIDKLLFLL